MAAYPIGVPGQELADDIRFPFGRCARESKEDHPGSNSALSKDNLAEVLVRSDQDRSLGVRQIKYVVVGNTCLELGDGEDVMAQLPELRGDRLVDVLVEQPAHARRWPGSMSSFRRTSAA